jgi:hypothetical protein
MVDPLGYKLESLNGIFFPVRTSLPPVVSLQSSDDQEGDVVVEVDKRIRLRRDQQSEEGECGSFGYIFDEEVLDVDEYFILTEDGDGDWVTSSCQFEILVDLTEFTHLDFVLETLEALFGLGEFLHAFQGLLDEDAGVGVGDDALGCACTVHVDNN